jgi:hypothetical protein
LPDEVLLTQQIYQFPNSVGTLHALDALAYAPQLWVVPLSDEEVWSQETAEYEALEGRNLTTGY